MTEVIALSNKKMKVLVIVLVFLVIILFIGLMIPLKFNLGRNFLCSDEISGEKIHVKIEGEYFKYLLRDDEFHGKIIVDGKREADQWFRFTDDTYGNFNDEYGQPEGAILQYDMFKYISIADKDYQISSDWDESWSSDFERKVRLNKLINIF